MVFFALKAQFNEMDFLWSNPWSCSIVTCKIDACNMYTVCWKLFLVNGKRKICNETHQKRSSRCPRHSKPDLSEIFFMKSSTFHVFHFWDGGVNTKTKNLKNWIWEDQFYHPPPPPHNHQSERLKMANYYPHLPPRTHCHHYHHHRRRRCLCKRTSGQNFTDWARHFEYNMTRWRHKRVYTPKY